MWRWKRRRVDRWVLCEEAEHDQEAQVEDGVVELLDEDASVGRTRGEARGESVARLFFSLSLYLSVSQPPTPSFLPQSTHHTVSSPPLPFPPPRLPDNPTHFRRHVTRASLRRSARVCCQSRDTILKKKSRRRNTAWDSERDYFFSFFLLLCFVVPRLLAPGNWLASTSFSSLPQRSARGASINTFEEGARRRRKGDCFEIKKGGLF